ncbi:bifunctional aldolase/short-chain dehydrogenase [Polyangium sp. 6x1]|uniref:bifunctional aldolase/short-chain dehydrogenase n=1 Tax=Polyangium sp. 6x1 TaxID=3042689 RepID=UPI0024824CC4|nr:bifunctional aldolase/short-chain dehydrogenase [Polyangium sp. 6x1]MDI1443963.1 bifunctional aldolase/short-chain dehydrogenase [Polyangium sp. 6x1]
MESRYRAAEAAQFVETFGPRWGEDLALRVYTSRLLGQDPDLVLHGGGNTSVKTRVTELVGDTTDVLYVKGSGWDLGAIEPEGFPACRLAQLRRLCELPSMTDEQMVSLLRSHMLEPSAPTPSVEALLHAYLPFKFIDHTHADAVLAIVDQPNSNQLVREVFGDRVLFIPYVMPGFALAKKVADLWRALTRAGREPNVMILDKHGIFTWGESAMESYERMIANVTRAERWVEEATAISRRTISSPSPDACSRLAPMIRGALARASGERWICSFRMSPQMVSFCDRDDLEEITQKGPATPDHVLRTKPKPLLLPPLNADDRHKTKATLDAAITAYAEQYKAYFRRCSAARPGDRRELDPWPRVLLIEGLGAFTVGKTRKDAEITADIYEHTTGVIEQATANAGYEPASELDIFDVEYWSLEQAKLKKGAGQGKPLDRHVAFVTGAASGIGLATARALLAAGAHVALTDRDEAALERATKPLLEAHDDRIFLLPCDVTSKDEVRAAIRKATLRFGGLDVVVSNAGAAFEGPIHGEQGDSALRASLEVNLLGHQNVARFASDVLIQQGAGGALLFNASKSAFNQGPDFGPYAIPKAALVALTRQYAVDLAPYGIRSNAVNADRIRTGIFAGGMLEARARARGVGVDEYFRANLLRRETTAADVAQAFLYLATAEATTGCVITVDGGNAAAFPR